MSTSTSTSAETRPTDGLVIAGKRFSSRFHLCTVKQTVECASCIFSSDPIIFEICENLLVAHAENCIDDIIRQIKQLFTLGLGRHD